MSHHHVNTALKNSVTPAGPSREWSPKIFASGRPLRVGVLSNPLSGGNQNGLGSIQKAVDGFSQTFHHQVETPADIGLALANLAKKQVDILAVNGGDGTVQGVLTVLFHHRPFEIPPLLALLRGGTANMLSKDLGIKGPREKAFQKLMNWAHRGGNAADIQQRPVLRVRTPGDPEPLYGLFFGAGAIYQGIRFFHKKVKTWGLRGELAHILILGRYLMALASRDNDVVSPVPIHISLDRRPLERREYVLVIISTLERLILGLRACWGTEAGPLQFTAVGGRPRHLLRTVLGLALSRKNPSPKPENGYYSHRVQQVQLNLQSGFTLDGELHMPDPQRGPVVVETGGLASFLRL